MENSTLKIRSNDAEYCRKVCGFNKKCNRISKVQFQNHLNSKKHVALKLSEKLCLNGLNENLQSEFNENNQNRSATEYENSIQENGSALHSNEPHSNSYWEKLSSEKKKFYFWIKINGDSLSRKATRSFFSIFSGSKSKTNFALSEHKIKKIDKELEQICFKLEYALFDDKKVLHLPISELLKGMMRSIEFQNYLLLSNGIPIARGLDLSDYKDCSLDIIFSRKFQNVMSMASSNTIYVGLIIFSDDFGKEKRSTYIPIDVIYIAIANLPLNKRYKHENVFVFSIANNFKYFESISLLKKSIDIFNSKQESFHFDAVIKDFKISVFIQLFSCDNPRTMNILNLATGKVNIFCRSCLTSRNNPSNLKETRNPEAHYKMIDLIRKGESPPKNYLPEFGIKYSNDLNLLEFEFFQPFHDFPFDILHSIYLGLVKHALRDTFKILTKLQKQQFLKYYRQLNTSGIYYLPRRDIVKNVKSLSGKDFKAISMVIFNCLHAIGISTELLNAWQYICYIVKFVNKKNISPIVLENFIKTIDDAAACIRETFPSLTTCVKIHLCQHLVENISNHGVPLGYTTETFESFNKILRKYISKTNQHNYANDAISKYYECFRTNFLNKNNILNFTFQVEDDLAEISSERNTFEFKTKFFDGYYEEFIKSDILQNYQILKQFFTNCPWKFSLFKWIHGQKAQNLFLKQEQSFYQYVLGIEVLKVQTVEKYFLAHHMVFCSMPNCYRKSSEQCIRGFKNVEVVNFQHDCGGAQCDFSGKVIQHANVEKYLLNEWIY